MADGLFTIDHKGMPRIISALKPDHYVRFGGQKVNHLPLALIAPLRSHYDYIRHCSTPNS